MCLYAKSEDVFFSPTREFVHSKVAARSHAIQPSPERHVKLGLICPAERFRDWELPAFVKMPYLKNQETSQSQREELLYEIYSVETTSQKQKAQLADTQIYIKFC